MEDKLCRDLVCRRLCSFYKPGREMLKCGTVEFIERNLSTGEIRLMALETEAECDFSEDEAIREIICLQCDFRQEGCDFRAGKDSPPCGGYVIVENLLRGSRHLAHSVWLCRTSEGWKGCT